VADDSSCDADTGVCAGDAAAQSAGQASAGPVIATTLDQSSGWGTSLALMILVTMLTIGLVLVPALAWRYFAVAGQP
ncbi:MAG: hypothetical protein FD127_4146, partial [Acidimicrobiaceae bacterium]